MLWALMITTRQFLFSTPRRTKPNLVELTMSSRLSKVAKFIQIDRGPHLPIFFQVKRRFADSFLSGCSSDVERSATSLYSSQSGFSQGCVIWEFNQHGTIIRMILLNCNPGALNRRLQRKSFTLYYYDTMVGNKNERASNAYLDKICKTRKIGDQTV
jgi:hypothetical protein